MGMLRTKAKTSERIHVYIYFSGLPTTAPTMVLRQIAAICLDLLLFHLNSTTAMHTTRGIAGM